MSTTRGVGTTTPEAELARMTPSVDDAAPITNDERRARIGKAQRLLREKNLQALYLDASTSLYYFTGLDLHPSERLHGAILPVEGELVYLVPAFEENKTRSMLHIGDQVRTWEEHEDPTALVIDTLAEMHIEGGTLALDEATRFFTFDGLRKAGPTFDFVNGDTITAGCRMYKSPQELALIQAAMDLTLEVQKATARMLRAGMTTTEVADFVTEAHLRLGAPGPPTFCIVLFGEPTAYPHGVPYPQTLKDGDMVLVDTGFTLERYHSDITRTYVYGTPTDRQRQIWNLEKAAQAAGFAAAQVGTPCEAVDAAARGVIEAAGFGPGYAVPGLPHRTGHGIGLDIHEWPYLTKGNTLPLAPGMCFSNEPMICIYGEFGIRLEDHFYMTEAGPRWFTQPCRSIDDPFA